jgi:methylenetetrahydrofolate reductase (NADPH)
MKRIIDIIKEKKRVFSFELFPTKTEDGYQKLLKTIESLTALNPDFMSVTYGAGGGSRDKTLDLVEHIQKKHNITGMAHLTCVLHSKGDIARIVNDIKDRGIQNILALKGDPPKDNPTWEPSTESFKYSSELTGFIRSTHKNHFGIAVAGFPEGHILCPDRDQDAHYLKMKVDAGADFVITQLFFDNKDYFDYVDRLRKRGVTVPVLPGIIPITDYEGLIKFCAICGATVTEEIMKIFEPIKSDKTAVKQAGIEFAVKQCKELLKHGAPGLHFYTLNKVSPTDEILKAVRR